MASQYPAPVAADETATAGVASTGSVILNQSLFSPNALRSWAPVRTTEPFEPRIATCRTRPPSAWGPARPLRSVTSIAKSWPTAGYLASTVATGTLACQVWLALPTTASPSSATAGNVPPAVYPPVEEENSVRATAPSSRRTSPAVSAMARSVLASSMRTLLRPAPP